MTDTPSLLAIFDALPYPVFAKNARHEWVYGNAEFVKIIGRDDFIGMTDADLFPPHQVEIFWREDDLVLAGQESLNEEEIGEDVYALTRKVPIELAGGEPGLVGIIIASVSDSDLASDIHSRFESRLRETAHLVDQLKADMRHKTETLKQKLLHRELELSRALEIAHTDAATGLRNRLGFEEDLQEAIRKYEDKGRVFALVFLDVDHFKRINDRFGHETGDKVLKLIGRRVRKLPNVISVARIGGDEFAVITERPSVEVDDRQADLEEAQHYVFRSLIDGSKHVELSGSAGVCVFPEQAETADQLKRRADLALLHAKSAGRNCLKIFDETLGQAADRRRLVEEELPKAIREETIEVVFQPIVCSATRHVRGVEALARWHHEELGVVPPQEFVGIANDMGLTSRLDAAVFRKAARQARELLNAGLIEYVSFNVCPNDIIDPDYACEMLERIDAAGIKPHQVFLEVIESSIVRDIQAASDNLRELGASGVKMALDDYGTGFSNLRALLDLPLHRLKIDRSMVVSLESNDRMLDFLVSIMQLAQGMGVDVVAEGIETARQAMFVEAAGCQFMQGFHFGRGVPVRELDALLQSGTLQSQVA
ncbi:MAG: EAL domain-containing protein [Hyphomonadaceae bacterium]|nr:EAL domain-containing protein [Hyphomonadaceae bacterium]